MDSGAQFIVLDRAAAARSGHTGDSELDRIGVGLQLKAARMANAASVEIGDLVFDDCCPVIIADGRALDGIDGVIPLSLFAAFLVRLDIPGKNSISDHTRRRCRLGTGTWLVSASPRTCSLSKRS